MKEMGLFFILSFYFTTIRNYETIFVSQLSQILDNFYFRNFETPLVPLLSESGRRLWFYYYQKFWDNLCSITIINSETTFVIIPSEFRRYIGFSYYCIFVFFVSTRNSETIFVLLLLQIYTLSYKSFRDWKTTRVSKNTCKMTFQNMRFLVSDRKESERDIIQ